MGERILRIVQLQLRDESLDGKIFYSIKELRVLAKRWRVHYYTVTHTPHWDTNHQHRTIASAG